MTGLGNPFLDIADRQLAAPVKAKHRAQERRLEKSPLVPTAMEKELRDQQRQVRRWRAWHREKEQALLDGPHGDNVETIVTFLKRMALSSAPELVTLIEQAAWLRNADREVRGDVLTLIGRGILRLRERNGLTPFDDALPGEPANAYLQIRELLR